MNSNNNQEMKMCRNEIYNDNLYKEVMERIEDEWITHKANTMEKPTADEMCEFINEFRNEQANQENSGEDYCIEFDNNKQLMLYQKWCYLNVFDNFGTCENNIDLFNMRTLKNQVIYWIMEEFGGFEEDWEDEEEEEEEQE
tara:strand:+ start:169 stop:591 length:423 start_codon:yes stop_codon:yes gene_type:complete